jgi:putative proteasome-type protease
VISLLRDGLPAPIGDETCATPRQRRPSMFRVAQLVGEAVQMTSTGRSGGAGEAINLNSSVSLLLGGRIGDAPPALYQVYSAGNFIECKPESPFLQIGETKYGKPILDRGVAIDTPLDEAVKVAFLSFDSAMRSNLGVARPLDLIVMPRDRAKPILTRRIEPDDEYFNELSLRWAVLLHEATRRSPTRPSWMKANPAPEGDARGGVKPSEAARPLRRRASWRSASPWICQARRRLRHRAAGRSDSPARPCSQTRGAGAIAPRSPDARRRREARAKRTGRCTPLSNRRLRIESVEEAMSVPSSLIPSNCISRR